MNYKQIQEQAKEEWWVEHSLTESMVEDLDEQHQDQEIDPLQRIASSLEMILTELRLTRLGQ